MNSLRDSTRNRNHPGLLAILGFAALVLTPVPALAQVAPNLGTTAPFTVLGLNTILPTVGTVTCTDTGPGVGIFGQVGSTFNAITNTLCTITGPTIAPVAAGVVTDFNNALTNIDLQNAVCTGPIPIVTTTLGPGVYCSNAATTIGAGVTITLSGTASDVWVFRTGTTAPPGALTLNSAHVVMGGNASPCNVYWKTTAADFTATDAIFVGTVLADGAATMTRGTWIGRMMAGTDATLTDPDIVGCAAAAAAGAATTPTLSEWAMVMLAALLAVAGFAAMRRRRR